MKKILNKKFVSLIIFLGVTLMQSCSNNNSNQKYDYSFLDLEKQLKTQNDPLKQQDLIDNYLKNLNKDNYPIFESDTTVVLLYQSDTDSAFVLGDMANWAGYLPMTKIEHTNLFYFRDNYETDARLEYWVSTSREGLAGVDPLNPFQVWNGFGPMSELAMPMYERHPYFTDYIFGKKGNHNLVKPVEIESEILKYSHQLHVYLPPDYEKSEQIYPVVYIQDGIDYVEFAITSHVIDNMIRANEIAPIIAVFITPPNRFKPDFPNRMSEYGLNDDYVKFFADELVPFIDKKYKTKNDADSRLVIGDSFGGLISAYIPFMRPDIFALGYSQSGYVSFQNDNLIKVYTESEKKPIRLYVDVGTYERQVGGAFLPKRETDFLEANRRFKNVLEEKGYDFIYREYHEGHTWGNWRRHLIDGLVHFFSEKNK